MAISLMTPGAAGAPSAGSPGTGRAVLGPRVRSLAEAEVHVVSLTGRVDELERLVSDHAQRFDTLQTPWWKRVWFWVDGWPHYDLNAPRRQWRPWHRGE